MSKVLPDGLCETVLNFSDSSWKEVGASESVKVPHPAEGQFSNWCVSQVLRVSFCWYSEGEFLKVENEREKVLER